MTKNEKRLGELIPGGVLRYIRCYKADTEAADPYTIVFTGRRGGYYVSADEKPSHPQGFYQHGDGRIDMGHLNDYKRPPAIGRKNHLGLRIPFADLPWALAEAIRDEYMEIWGLEKRRDK